MFNFNHPLFWKGRVNFVALISNAHQGNLTIFRQTLLDSLDARCLSRLRNIHNDGINTATHASIYTLIYLIANFIIRCD
jgi:hypothetical protein